MVSLVGPDHKVGAYAVPMIGNKVLHGWMQSYRPHPFMTWGLVFIIPWFVFARGTSKDYFLWGVKTTIHTHKTTLSLACNADGVRECSVQPPFELYNTCEPYVSHKPHLFTGGGKYPVVAPPFIISTYLHPGEQIPYQLSQLPNLLLHGAAGNSLVLCPTSPTPFSASCTLNFQGVEGRQGQGQWRMSIKLAANLSFLFKERAILDRFNAAAQAGRALLYIIYSWWDPLSWDGRGRCTSTTLTYNKGDEYSWLEHII